MQLCTCCFCGCTGVVCSTVHCNIRSTVQILVGYENSSSPRNSFPTNSLENQDFPSKSVNLSHPRRFFETLLNTTLLNTTLTKLPETWRVDKLLGSNRWILVLKHDLWPNQQLFFLQRHGNGRVYHLLNKTLLNPALGENLDTIRLYKFEFCRGPLLCNPRRLRITMTNRLRDCCGDCTLQSLAELFN